ncbi:MAG TPA: FkbM family methyltransferase, partial [Acidobacteriaceae bacterium]|nr:FkbM family methyltransferase [Acidobacteriaceae bacterium]
MRTLEIQIPGYSHPFFARWPASDLHILHTIIRGEEYAPLAASLDPMAPIFFLDLGANIGAASLYFLNRYPRARVLAVEPGAGNAGLCRRNLEFFGERARVVEAAAWSRNIRLVFRPETTQTGTEAGIRLREPDPHEEAADAIDGFDIPSLLAEAAVLPEVPIAVKMDIEGSEAEIFSGSNLNWLDGVC